MDESRHPERDNAPIEISNDQQHSLGDDGADTNMPGVSNASSNTSTGSKRALEGRDDTNNATNPAKKVFTESDRTSNDLNGDEVHVDASNTSPDDLDLDALMAQLQHHTDKVGTPTQDSEESRKEEDNTEEHQDNVDPIGSHDIQLNVDSIEKVINGLQAHNDEHREISASNEDTGHSSAAAPITEQANESSDGGEPELSIEQQLKGALSSLEFDGNNLEIGLDQLSQLLTSGDTDTAKEGESPTERSRDSESSTSGYDKTSEPGERIRRNSLISKMPPPPAHLHGKLPPMPPPPPAFTSPIASSLPAAPESPTITEVASPHLPQTAQISVPRVDAAASATQGPSHVKIAQSSTAEPPAPLREDYERSLLNQVETAQKEQSAEHSESNKDEGAGGDNAKESTQAGGDSTSAATSTPIFINDNKAILNARGRSILLLDSLALQVLETLSCSHYQETLSTVMQPESERGMIYRILLDAFEDIKRVYMKWETNSSRISPQVKPDESRPFLSYNIPGVEPTRDNLTTIQRVNVATFVAALFGSIEIGFWELDEWFIRVFVPESGRLLKQQANIYLDLKTQAYISAVESSDDKEVHKKALDHLFPTDLESKLLFLFGDRIHLAPQEKDFVAKCLRRRDNIQSEEPADLSKKYHWVPFLREVSDYISKNHTTLLPPRKRTVLLPDTDASVSYERSVSHPPAPRSYPAPRRQVLLSYSRSPPVVSAANSTASPSATSKTASSDATGRDNTPAETPSGTQSVTNNEAQSETRSGKSNTPDEVQVTSVKPTEASSEQGKDEKSDVSDGKDVSSKDAESTQPKTKESTESSRQGPNIPSEGHPMFPPLPKQVLPPPSMRQQTPLSPRKPPPASEPSIPVQEGVNTLAAYEAAKASAEGTDAVRPKASMFTTRRTWTKQEEEALLKGMDKVQGPYWSQILELYGPGGKISEVLKDRTQVQLKDKARNLKMFFVRLGLPIPAVFQYVTGDYESRKSSGKRLRRMRSQYELLQSPSQANNPETALQRPDISRPPSSTGTHSTEPTNSGNHQETTTNSYDHGQNSLNNTPSRDTDQMSEARPTESSEERGNDNYGEKHEGAKSKETPDYDQISAEGERNSDTAHKEPDLSDILEDPNDRDDLNTLLNRVGEYVDNH